MRRPIMTSLGLSNNTLRSMKRLGENIQIARKRRRMTIFELALRVGVDRKTIMRLEKGDPSCSIGTLAMTLDILGLILSFNQLADPSLDKVGLALEINRLPKRVRSE